MFLLPRRARVARLQVFGVAGNTRGSAKQFVGLQQRRVVVTDQLGLVSVRSAAGDAFIRARGRRFGLLVQGNQIAHPEGFT